MSRLQKYFDTKANALLSLSRSSHRLSREGGNPCRARDINRRMDSPLRGKDGGKEEERFR
jgi:hypothetical protein